MNMNHRRSTTGFTLIELLVVIAIITLLASILMPSLNRAGRIARQTMCLSNIRNIGLANSIYAQENDGWFPHVKVEVTSYPDYFSDHGRYIIRTNQASSVGRWVNLGILVRDEMMGIQGLFCPSGDSYPPTRWDDLHDNAGATHYSHYSMHALYYQSSSNPYSVAPRVGFAPEGDSAIPLAADCNTNVNYLTKMQPGLTKLIPWFSTEVTMWHENSYNVVYLDGRAVQFDYDDDMFIGASWHLGVNSTNWSFFNFVKSK